MRTSVTARAGLLLGALALATALAAPAQALQAPPSHPYLGSLVGIVIQPGEVFVPPPEGEFEDACGVAVDAEGDLYVSDYYHRSIYVYGPGGEYLTRIADPEPDGPCNLAVGSNGDLYVNHWHRDVVRYSPSSYPPGASTGYGPPVRIDSAHSTGVAVDPATGDLYIDDLTYIARYEAPLGSEPDPEPAQKIGLGSLTEGYGVAVSSFGPTAGDVYVSDAGTGTVKVFEPGEPDSPAQRISGLATPQHGFNSLYDSNVAVDAKSGHLYVADNLGPGYESPAAVIDEFNAAGDYRGQLPHPLIEAEPTPIAIDGQSHVYVGDGNTEEAAIQMFGPTEPAASLEVARSGSGEGSVTSDPAGIDCPAACRAEYNLGSEVELTAIPAPGSVFVRWSGGCNAEGGGCALALDSDTTVTAEFAPAPQQSLQSFAGGAGGEEASLSQSASAGQPARARSAGASHSAAGARSSVITQKGNLRVRFEGGLAPHRLPRQGAAPVKVTLGGKIATSDGSNPPQLRRISIAINSAGRLDPTGLPTCEISQIQPSTTAGALEACRHSLVGEGAFLAKVLIPAQAPFPSNGKVFAFNGRYRGHPAILAHVFGTEPAPISTTIPFVIHHTHGRYGTVLSASLPQATGEWGYVTGLRLSLGRSFSYRGERRSYLSAGCSAPTGFSAASFPLARASFGFANRTLRSVLTDSCRVRG